MDVVVHCSATFLMYTLSKYHQNKSYQKYTGWSRVQILSCIFLSNPIALDLIYLNSFGCLISVHIFYSLSNYKVLHILASRSVGNHKIVHFVADGFIHGTPALLSYMLITPQAHPYKNYVWILPAVTHVVYPYLLIQSWNPTELYDIPLTFPTWKYAVGW